jgi:hypothetical protein
MIITSNAVALLEKLCRLRVGALPTQGLGADGVSSLIPHPGQKVQSDRVAAVGGLPIQGLGTSGVGVYPHPGQVQQSVGVAAIGGAPRFTS